MNDVLKTGHVYDVATLAHLSSYLDELDLHSETFSSSVIEVLG
jgi:hypothetical protein